MESRIAYRVNPEKALEAIVWVASEQKGIGFYHLVKVLFFADKAHLERYGRPIIGDRYIAMTHGPVPSLVYDMLKRDDFLDPDLIDEVERSIDFPRTNGHPTAVAKREPRLDVFSRTDLECLRESLKTYGRKSFRELWDLTHGIRAYVEAPANGEMDYALIVDDGPDRDRLVEEMRETAPYVSL